jgi:hypothetical protein
MKDAITKEREARAEKWETIIRSPNNRHRLGLATLMIFMVSLSGSSIIYWYYTIIYSQVGITDPTTQTGIQAGLNVLTWFSQIAAVVAGRKVGRKTILLWVWPMLLVCLVGLCASRYVRSHLSISFALTVQWSLCRNRRKQQGCIRCDSRLRLAVPHHLQFRQPSPLVVPRGGPDLLDAIQGSARLEYCQPDHGRVCHLGRRHCSRRHWIQVLCGLHALGHHPILPRLPM